jgi:DNA-binding transcriptional regulator YdaS (Cro superfamily)
MQTLLDKTNKLKLYLCCIGMTGTEFAKTIDYTPQLITGYMAGRKRLGRKAAKLIEMGTQGNVTMQDVLKFNPAMEKNMIEYKPKEDV